MNPQDAPQDDLSCQRFRELIETDFEVWHDETSVALKLIEVSERHDAPRFEQFSLIFLGPRDPLLPQRIHRFEHPRLGPRDLFAVPIGPDGEGMLYEVIFNRMRREEK